ncbi:hypothetical protein V495_01582 [Pseudogymnoascus sp. VKM F-4514 (FW-929)]|nr:hypothetical protein V495_01582 [Pseudogymnoascus sp. VKM F-4514 (FW-929)]KFY57284.1 hypothetical protein V497_05639 [Pseudogymnoascus sp. VKM F-4516 (FW-969)]
MPGPPPLTGIRVLEFAGLAPGPFAGLLLADNGASVLRIDRAIPGSTHSDKLPPPTSDALTRHKSSIAVDLKDKAGIDFIKALVKNSDIVIDPFRPGVLEKLGLGPDILKAVNPRIILGRMTGFRRDGKYKDMAGHDINYIGVSGALHILGRKGEKPFGPVNILGDFAGGGATLFQGLLLALLAREKTGEGQVVEANMVDGSAYLATFIRLGYKTPMFNQPRGENPLDSASPFYDTYETKDGKFVAVGALEPQFFHELVKGLGVQDRGFEETRFDRSTWPEMKELFTTLFKEKTRTEWEGVFDGTDACVTPVFEFHELETDPSREGDVRPAVHLKDTPGLAIRRDNPSTRDLATGQGEGVRGDGWDGTYLRPSQNGEKTIHEWLGWSRSNQYDVQNGGLVLKDKAKI